MRGCKEDAARIFSKAIFYYVALVEIYDVARPISYCLK